MIMILGGRLAHFQCCRLANLCVELPRQSAHVVSEDHRFVARAGYRDVTDAGVEQVRMNARVGVDEDAHGGESLGAVDGDCMAVIKVAVLGGVEFNLPVIVKLGGDTAIERNGVCRWTSQCVPSWPAFAVFPATSNSGA
jgi:hypothetical protein